MWWFATLLFEVLGSFALEGEDRWILMREGRH